jgi:2-oxoglutarate ferredoxin oxidoreductase subunit alpha
MIPGVVQKASLVIKDLSVMIAGKAGDGVLFTGNVLARLLKRHGWEVATYRDFPSNIRGEATSYIIRASLDKVYGLSDRLDILLAFDCDATIAHLPKIDRRGIVFCDGEGEVEPPAEQIRGKTFHKFPLRALARERFGQEIFKNMLALGALAYILNLDCALLEVIIGEMFLKRKGEEIVKKNVEAAAFGWEKAGEITSGKDRHPLTKKPDEDRILISGDEAIAFGALAAGCRYFAAYPICPASEIHQWLVHYMPEANGVVVQTEDELAALNMALGAAFAGARAMTATSGPGASLMMEAFGLAGMAEIPVVIAHVQRLGPATGVPTKTQQGDVLQWIFGSHGEFPRIVLSPGTVGECFDLTAKAFNLAEKYQCPVIILTELDMGQNFRTARQFDFAQVKIDRGKLLSRDEVLGMEDYRRYEFTADGISRRALPSTGRDATSNRPVFGERGRPRPGSSGSAQRSAPSWRPWISSKPGTSGRTSSSCGRFGRFRQAPSKSSSNGARRLSSSRIISKGNWRRSSRASSARAASSGASSTIRPAPFCPAKL